MNASVIKHQQEIQALQKASEPLYSDYRRRLADAAYGVPRPTRSFPGFSPENSANFYRMLNGNIGSTTVNMKNNLGRQTNKIHNFQSTFRYPLSSIKRDAIKTLKAYKQLIIRTFHELYGEEELFLFFTDYLKIIDSWIQFIDNIDENSFESIYDAILKTNQIEIIYQFKSLAQYFIDMFILYPEHPVILAGSNMFEMFKSLHESLRKLLALQSNFVGGRTQKRRNRKTLRRHFKSQTLLK
jgi:hypothetical protein